MKEILNVKVKHREEFRPFAPVVPREMAQEIFQCDSSLPSITDYMLMVYPTKDNWQDKIPSVVHVDGSARLQTTSKESNPLYYDLLNEFSKLSGVPVLINTSFNVRGEPIVCTPKDAYNCFVNTEIDYLVLGRFLITKQ
jgi:carbamoyltransferase